MSSEEKVNLSPNDIYRKIRPEYFSDSKKVFEVELTKEILSHELENVSVNQKQDQFQVLCRKLAEKFVCPNLIPEVGPSGGGDGKVDTESHAVSKLISDKWYIPEHGWTNDNKWAFAISSKEDWRGKLRSDIKSIKSTERDYTLIHFMTNRKISSKKKKEVEDKFSEEFEVEIRIFDGQWIIDRVIDNNLEELVVNSLNMSEVYKKVKISEGARDIQRKELMKELEEDIEKPNRYFEVDYQLVEDCLQSAILSRELEDSREVIEGKFLRTLRFANKLKNINQLCRIYYQYAWTSIFWFNDFDVFEENFLKVKQLAHEDINTNTIKLYHTLHTVLKNHNEEFTLNVDNETEEIYKLLDKVTADKEFLTLSLTAESFHLLSLISDSLHTHDDCGDFLNKLGLVIKKAEGHISYPFDSVHKSIQVFGKILPDSYEYDNLIEKLASINEKRSSELVASDIYVGRAIDKFKAGLYKDAVIWLGKSIVRLSKEESRDRLIPSISLLGKCYRNIGLLWASNNCFTFAAVLSLKSWFKEGYIEGKSYDLVIDLAKNEVMLGRIPLVLSTVEFANIILNQIGDEYVEDDFENSLPFIDTILSNRILNSDLKENNLTQMPDIYESLGLEFASDSSLYLLGYNDKIIESVNKE